MDKSPVVDYRALLVKYMREVIECEGVSFVGMYVYADIGYTPDERAALEHIEQEAHDLINPPP